LYKEMRGRIKEDDNSVPYFFNGYWYITRFKKNKDYPIYIRKKGNLKTKEEILFDCNVMAKGHEYFDLVSFSVSPDNTKIAFGVDTISRRQYTIQVKDLVTKKILKTKIFNLVGKLSINESASIIKKSKKVYTHDTGMMHIAAALKKEIVSIWGSSHPILGFYPYNSKFTVLQNAKIKCRPCSKIGHSSCPLSHFRCMNEMKFDI